MRPISYGYRAYENDVAVLVGEFGVHKVAQPKSLKARYHLADDCSIPVRLPDIAQNYRHGVVKRLTLP